MTKKANLAEALGKFHPATAPQTRAAEKTKPERATPVPKSRQDKKTVAGFFDPAVSTQLKMLGLEQGDRSVQDLLTEALNDLFRKYKKPPIA